MGSVVHLRVLEGSMTEEPKGDTADGLTATGPEEPVTKAPASTARSSRGGTLRYLGPIREACRRRALDATDRALLDSIADMFTEDREHAFVPMRELASRMGCGRDTATKRFGALVNRGIIVIIGYWLPDGRGWGTVLSGERLRERGTHRNLSPVATIDVVALGAAAPISTRVAPPTPTSRTSKQQRSSGEPTDHLSAEPTTGLLVQPTTHLSAEPTTGLLVQPTTHLSAEPTRSASLDPPLRSASSIRPTAGQVEALDSKAPTTVRSEAIERVPPKTPPPPGHSLPLLDVGEPGTVETGRLWDVYLRCRSDAGLTGKAPELTNQRREAIRRAVKEHGVETIELSIRGLWLSANHVEGKYTDISYALRPTNLDPFVSAARDHLASLASKALIIQQPSPKGRAVRAYGHGQRVASNQPYPDEQQALPDLQGLHTILTTYATGDTEEARLSSLAEISEAYRRAREACAEREDGFSPRACLRWLKGGRPVPTLQKNAPTFRNPHLDSGQQFDDGQRKLLATPKNKSKKDDEDD